MEENAYGNSLHFSLNYFFFLVKLKLLEKSINKKKNDYGLDPDSNQHFEQIAACLSLTNQEVITWPTTRGHPLILR